VSGLSGPRTRVHPYENDRPRRRAPCMTWWRVLDSDSDRMAPKQNESLFMHNTVCYITLTLHTGGYALLLHRKFSTTPCTCSTSCDPCTGASATERAVHVQLTNEIRSDGGTAGDSYERFLIPAGLNNRTAAVQKIQYSGVAIAGGNLSQIDSKIDILLQRCNCRANIYSVMFALVSRSTKHP